MQRADTGDTETEPLPDQSADTARNRHAAREVADAYALLGNLAQRAQAQARATGEARNALTLARQRHELGLATPLDALVAEAALLQRQDSEAEIHATRLRASVSLFKALGAPIKE